jgi:hypothetical protein
MDGKASDPATHIRMLYHRAANGSEMQPCNAGRIPLWWIPSCIGKIDAKSTKYAENCCAMPYGPACFQALLAHQTDRACDTMMHNRVCWSDRRC